MSYQMLSSAALIMVMACAIASALPGEAPAKVKIVLFWGDGCPHCASEHEYLASILEENQDVELAEYETWHDETNAQLFKDLSLRYGVEPRGVPATIIGDKIWIGFNEAMGREMRKKIDECLSDGCEDPMERLDEAVEANPIQGMMQQPGETVKAPAVKTSDSGPLGALRGFWEWLGNRRPWAYGSLAAAIVIVLIGQGFWARKKGE